MGVALVCIPPNNCSLRPGNNKVLNFFGSTLEDFSQACKAAFSHKFKDLLPKGRNCVRVRVTGKDKVNAKKKSTLGQTLGQEACGLVCVVFDGHPIRYNQLAVYENIVAKHRSVRFDIEATHDGRSWKRAQSSFELDDSTLDDVREKLEVGARRIREDGYVKMGDAHIDAKLFPCVHPCSAVNWPGIEGGKLRFEQQEKWNLLRNGGRWVRDRERVCGAGFWSAHAYGAQSSAGPAKLVSQK